MAIFNGRLVIACAVCGFVALAVGGEVLYNGIVLPEKWPPRINPNSRSPIRAPYLEPQNIPTAIPIDVGRQLFVDDFLVVSSTGIVRKFHKPVKYIGNPVMWPETKAELDQYERPPDCTMRAPGCCMPGGGVWWDPTRRRFRMWYLSGWNGALSLAESADGLKWDRPSVGPNGDNVLLSGLTVDTFSVWPDYSASNPYASWRLFIAPPGCWVRSRQFASPDGCHWTAVDAEGKVGDSSTLFYNPFRRKWVWSVRHYWSGGDRCRVYREHEGFIKGAIWKSATEDDIRSGRYDADGNAEVFPWLACDDADMTRTIDGTVRKPQLYNVDATPYESLMVGLFKIICGRDNKEAAKSGMPKTTTIHFAYSRDGFHFDRPDRTPAIADSDWGSGAWDTGYLGPCSSGFVIKDEQLWFYYVGARGDGTAKGGIDNGMHASFSVGIAKLRRDGFAGMVADGAGEVVTRPVVFSGSHFFVNADARFGALTAEVLDADGRPYPGYTATDCNGMIRVDSTKQAVTWKGGDISRFAGKPVRFRFRMKVATLYAFWVSRDASGKSGGYLAAGGPSYAGLKDD